MKSKNQFYCGNQASSNEAIEPSQSSSASNSETLSPNYMKATCSSSAKKGSLKKSPSNTANGSSVSVKSISKFSMVSVQDFSDPSGVNIPVELITDRRIKSVPCKQSMKTQARYSQFPDIGSDQSEMLGIQDNTEIINGEIEMDSESLDVNCLVGVEQKGILDGLKLRKLTWTDSTKSSRTMHRPESRLSGGGGTNAASYEAEVFDAESHYMKATSSQQARKNTKKGSATTSSLRPLRIQENLTSLKPEKNRLKKLPQATEVSATKVHRPTCSSTLRRTHFSDDSKLHSMDQEIDITSSFQVCPYSYCSIHRHRHHNRYQPLKSFISAKRRLFNNQKGEQPENKSSDEAQNAVSTIETASSERIISSERTEIQEMMNSKIENAPEAEDKGMDSLIKIYYKPKRMWVTEGAISQDAEALNIAIYDQIDIGECERQLDETRKESSEVEGKQHALEDQQTQWENSNITAFGSPLEFHDSNLVSINEILEPSIAEELQNSFNSPLHKSGKDSQTSLGSYLTYILSDKQKYTSMWQLIYQELVSNEASISEALRFIQVEEKESNDEMTCSIMNNKEDANADIISTEYFESEQAAVIKLVQEALNAILQNDIKSYRWHSKFVQEMAHSMITEENFIQGGQTDEKKINQESPEKQLKVKHISNTSLQGKDQYKQDMPGQKKAKGLSTVKNLFVSAKFFKAMENLKKINPSKPQYLAAESVSENERIYLRHLSINEKKSEEEWMLDYALRHAISNLDPDQQQRVAQLVEAFEYVAVRLKNKSRRPSPVTPVPGSKKATSTNAVYEQVEPQKDITISHEQLVQKQDNGTLVSHDEDLKEEVLMEGYEYQVYTSGDEILQKSAKTKVTDSTLVFSENSSNVVYVCNLSDGESSGNVKAIKTLKVPSENPTQNSEIPSPCPAGSSKIKPEDEIVNIIGNKQKYTNMWHLIYQHVLSNEASNDRKQEVNNTEEEDRENDAKYCFAIDDPTFNGAQMKKFEVDNDNEYAICEQFPAIKLGEEIHAILQCHKQSSGQKSLQDNGRNASSHIEIGGTDSVASTKENVGGKSIEKNRFSETEESFNKVETASVQLKQQEEPTEGQRKMSATLSKLKEVTVAARFTKAMERLRKISECKQQHLPAEETSEEERVYLRHISMNAKKNDEEWMLDYALRKLVSDLAPDQQRKVARLVEAFESVNPQHTMVFDIQ